MGKIKFDDPQVVEALKDLKHSYERIADLKTLEDPYLQFIAGDIIRFFEFRIKNIDEALRKKGLANYMLKPQR